MIVFVSVTTYNMFRGMPLVKKNANISLIDYERLFSVKEVACNSKCMGKKHAAMEFSHSSPSNTTLY